MLSGDLQLITMAAEAQSRTSGFLVRQQGQDMVPKTLKRGHKSLFVLDRAHSCSGLFFVFLFLLVKQHNGTPPKKTEV